MDGVADGSPGIPRSLSQLAGSPARHFFLLHFSILPPKGFIPSCSQCIISESVYLFIPQIPEQKQLSIPKTESPEGYYEEAEPYDTSLNGTSWGQGWGMEGVQCFLLAIEHCASALTFCRDLLQTQLPCKEGPRMAHSEPVYCASCSWCSHLGVAEVGTET